MKIAFVRHSLLNRGGDKIIVAYASSLADGGHQVVLKTNQINSIFKLSPRVIVEPMRFTGKTGTILTLLLDPVDADIIVADIIAMACLLSVKNKGRVLYFAQDYNENSYSLTFQKLFIRLLYSVCFNFFKVPVIAVSAELAQIFKRCFAADSTVIPNGVDVQAFYSDPDENLLRDKGSNKAILIFSRRDYRKGFDLALETIKQLAAGDANLLEVWTVGENLSDNDLPCEYKNFGYVNEGQLRRIMSSADIFLYPSRNEGFGLMPLEAMACGCPVVTTTAVSYAVHEVNAMVAPIEDCTLLKDYSLQLFHDDLLRKCLIETGKQFAYAHSLTDANYQFESALSRLFKPGE